MRQTNVGYFYTDLMHKDLLDVLILQHLASTSLSSSLVYVWCFLFDVIVSPLQIIVWPSDCKQYLLSVLVRDNSTYLGSPKAVLTSRKHLMLRNCKKTGQ